MISGIIKVKVVLSALIKISNIKNQKIYQIYQKYQISKTKSNNCFLVLYYYLVSCISAHTTDYSIIC